MNIKWEQPSTQRGIAVLLAGLLAVFGKEIPAEVMQPAVGVILSIAGAIGILRSDPPSK